MKKFFALCGLLSVLTGSRAQDEPVVGVWEKVPVSGPGGKLVARTNYIFTSTRLTKETVFSAVPDVDPLSVVCCIKVKNLAPLELDAVLAKFHMDEDFVSHLKSIKGAEFMYEAESVPKAEWNGLMTTIMNTDRSPDDQSPYSAPVISARLGDTDEKLEKLELGPTKAKLKITHSKKDHRVVYQFTVNTKKLVLSEETFAHD
jgi:hypothetical protein